MTILSIAASIIVAATTALFAFSVAAPRNAAPAEPPAPSPHRRADQRGITLQTLIIMAVLVLVATGVSVVLVGVTRGANDGLENAGQTSSEAKCEPWELYDPNYATAGIGSPTGKGGVWSSGIGCIRVCYARFDQGQRDPGVPGGTLVHDRILSYEDEASMPRGVTFTVASLEFSRPERIIEPIAPSGLPNQAAATTNTAILTIGGSQEYEDYPGDDFRAFRIIGLVSPTPFSFTQVITDPSEVNDPIPIGDLEIRVATDLRSCVLWDPATGKEIFRSQGTI